MPVSLNLKFMDEDGKSLSFTFPYANISATPSNVKALMQKMIDNSDVYIEQPVDIDEANFVNRTVTPVDIASVA